MVTTRSRGKLISTDLSVVSGSKQEADEDQPATTIEPTTPSSPHARRGRPRKAASPSPKKKKTAPAETEETKKEVVEVTSPRRRGRSASDLSGAGSKQQQEPAIHQQPTSISSPRRSTRSRGRSASDLSAGTAAISQEDSNDQTTAQTGATPPKNGRPRKTPTPKKQTTPAKQDLDKIVEEKGIEIKADKGDNKKPQSVAAVADPVDSPNEEEKRYADEKSKPSVSQSTGDKNKEAVVEASRSEESTPKKKSANEATPLTQTTKRKNKKIKGPKNELTRLIPGYTAPLKLNTSSLDKYRGGISELQKRAQQTDASTKAFVAGGTATKTHVNAMQKSSSTSTSLPSSYMAAYSSFKNPKKKRAADDKTAGKGWFHMNPTPMTAELKQDLAVVRNRSYLDPKKFYKSSDKTHEICQLGTVIEGSSEYFSSRLTKKQRRTNITEEIMADPQLTNYAVGKFKTMNREKQAQSMKRNKKKHKTGSKKKFY